MELAEEITEVDMEVLIIIKIKKKGEGMNMMTDGHMMIYSRVSKRYRARCRNWFLSPKGY